MFLSYVDSNLTSRGFIEKRPKILCFCGKVGQKRSFWKTLKLFQENEGELQDAPDDDTNDNNDGEDKTGDNGNAGGSPAKNRGAEVAAIFPGGRNVGGEGIIGDFDFGIFAEFVGPAVEITLIRPGPAVLNGEGLTDSSGRSIDITIGITIVDELITNLLNGGIGGAEI